MSTRNPMAPMLRPSLLAALVMVSTPVITHAADAGRSDDGARRDAEAEARRIEGEARRMQEDARRQMRDRERDQQEALRGQDQAIRRLEEAQRRLQDSSREVAELSSQIGRNFSYSFSSQGGQSPRVVLGVLLDRGAQREGALVRDVSPGGAAAEAGIKAGDLITHVAGLDVTKDSDPQRAVVEKLRQVEPDTKVQVGVLREGQKLNFDVVARAAPPPQVAPLPPMTGFSSFGPIGETRSFQLVQGRDMRNGMPQGAGIVSIAGGPEGPGGLAAAGAPGVPGSLSLRVGPGAISPMAQIMELAGDGSRLGGMEFATLSDRLGSYFGVQSGVLVVRAGADAPYTLQDGDVILAIDGREPSNAQHAGRILRSYQPGEKVKLRLQRDRKALNVDAVAPGRRND